jgi:hypothetical protein
MKETGGGGGDGDGDGGKKYMISSVLVVQVY